MGVRAILQWSTSLESTPNTYYYYIGIPSDDPEINLDSTFVCSYDQWNAKMTVNLQASAHVISYVRSWDQFLLKNPNEEYATLKVLQGKIFPLNEFRYTFDQCFLYASSVFRVSVKPSKKALSFFIMKDF